MFAKSTFALIGFVGLILPVVVLADWGGTSGSGVVKNEKRTVPPFNAIKTGGAFKISVVCQEQQSLEVTADDNLLPLITTEVKDGTLEIGTKESISNPKSLDIAVHIKDLSSLHCSGACKVSIAKLANDKLDIDGSGAMSVEASGKTNKLTASLSGAGRISAEALHVKDARITLSGAGKVDVDVSDSLSVSISGVGLVTYSGNPKSIQKQISGLGSLRSR
jgi:hypothetical protein